MEDGLNPIVGDCEGVSATESVLPEDTSNSGKETPAARVGPGFLETFNQIDGNYDTPNIVEDVTEVSEVNGEFIPGNLFNFEKVLEADNGIQENVHVLNKRKKKSFLGSVGLPNPTYSSSLEKTKVGKKPKCDEVGTLQIAPEDVSVDEAEDLSEGVDISSEGSDRPGHLEVSVDEYSHVSTTKPNQEGTDLEVLFTVELGKNVGAKLDDFHNLAAETIQKEGVQKGIK
ncbi:hypothetical protein L1987_29252 [Smallanthus sonchifolius]|uniref:Uncharacterized protein n=1 Tax=Smallanthus sonchifolius TaxID=185202 RepID=A0ACB9HZF4_9ASTR|nr:hypothetical protein L1987_29252 [Smallanthus sonchifolius]